MPRVLWEELHSVFVRQQSEELQHAQAEVPEVVVLLRCSADDRPQVQRVSVPRRAVLDPIRLIAQAVGREV